MAPIRKVRHSAAKQVAQLLALVINFTELAEALIAAAEAGYGQGI